MLYEMVELEEGVSVQFLAVHALRWYTESMVKPTCGFIELDPETTHEDLVRLKHIAQRAREELARAKPGSTLWEALRFILSPPIKGTEIIGKEPTWESAGRGYVDYPEPDQTYGAAD